MNRIAMLPLIALALASCGDDQQPPPPAIEGDAQAEGQVLEGTISDRMIPWEEIGASGTPVPLASPARQAQITGGNGAAEPTPSDPATAVPGESETTE